jgi:hypothetical protein
MFPNTREVYGAMSDAELLALKDGTKKEFYLLKRFGDALRANGFSNEYLRTLRCAQLVNLIRLKGLAA